MRPARCVSAENRPGGVPDRVGALIESLGLPREEIKLIFVNNVIVTAETVLRNGDNVALAPVTGGM